LPAHAALVDTSAISGGGTMKFFVPVQPYFESGFPFDRHQWISAAGTAWAAKAIAFTPLRAALYLLVPGSSLAFGQLNPNL